jgi:sec-independent protein translocase protein TatA
MPMGGTELLIILAIILLFFGSKRVPELGRSLGKSIREFRAGASVEDEKDEVKQLPNDNETREKADPQNGSVNRSEEARVSRTSEQDL